MKTKEVPQDGPENNVFKTTLLKYAVNDHDEFVPIASDGWIAGNIAAKNLKAEFIEMAEQAKERVKKDLTSPLEYFMYRSFMDLPALSQQMGFSQRKVKKHMNPRVFSTLDDGVLSQYAYVFLTDVATIKNFEKEIS